MHQTSRHLLGSNVHIPWQCICCSRLQRICQIRRKFALDGGQVPLPTLLHARYEQSPRTR